MLPTDALLWSTRYNSQIYGRAVRHWCSRWCHHQWHQRMMTAMSRITLRYGVDTWCRTMRIQRLFSVTKFTWSETALHMFTTCSTACMEVWCSLQWPRQTISTWLILQEFGSISINGQTFVFRFPLKELCGITLVSFPLAAASLATTGKHLRKTWTLWVNLNDTVCLHLTACHYKVSCCTASQQTEY